jgi:hypothetical protein
MAERTGSLVFSVLWSYVIDNDLTRYYNHNNSTMPVHCLHMAVRMGSLAFYTSPNQSNRYFYRS